MVRRVTCYCTHFLLCFWESHSPKCIPSAIDSCESQIFSHTGKGVRLYINRVIFCFVSLKYTVCMRLANADVLNDLQMNIQCVPVFGDKLASGNDIVIVL